MRARLSALVVLVPLLLAGCGDSTDSTGHAEPTPAPDGARSVKVSARSFAFDPKEITVKAGEDVEVVLQSKDIEHDLTIDELKVHIHTPAGKTSSGGLNVATAGTYTFYCSVAGHRSAGMEGTLVVE